MLQVARVFTLVVAAAVTTWMPWGLHLGQVALGIHLPGSPAAHVQAARFAESAYPVQGSERADTQAVTLSIQVVDQMAAAQAAAEARAKADAEAAAAAEADRQAAAARAAAAASRPAVAAPAAAPGPAATGAVPDIIRAAFAPQGQAVVDWALRVAKCESGYNPNAYNPAGPYMGLFQFDARTWGGTPYAGQSWYDANANARAAAWLYQQRGASPWGCR